MPLFHQKSLETLRQRIDIIEVVSSHVELKRSGATYKALCPFHDEKTPSFVIQRGDHHYHCFGCGAHGDAIQFLMTHHKMSFSDAVESLAQQFGVHLDYVEESQEYKGPSKGKLKNALDTACCFFQFYLLHTNEGHKALHYLYERNLDLDFVRHFKVGLAPKERGLFRKFMHEKSVSDEIMVAAGLLKEGRDFFYDRIMFPINQATGAVIGFSGRKYKDETFGGKYVNTPETVLFKKSRVLYGLNYCRRRIAKERKAIVVEGQIDALQLIQTGFDFTVAGQGTAFGEGHVKALTTLGVNRVYLAMDPDDAGREATKKIGNFFQNEGVEIRVVQMPEGYDPDTYLNEKGPEGFQTLLEGSIEYVPFLIEYLSKTHNINTPAGKNELVNSISKQIRGWDQKLMAHESLRKLAHLAQVPEDMLGIGQEHLPNIHIQKSGTIGLLTINTHRILESDFIRWLILLGESMPTFVEIAKVNLQPERLHDALCRRLYQTYLEHVEKQLPRDLLSLIKDDEMQQLVNEIMGKRVNMDLANEHFIETIQKILYRNWMEEREELRQKIQSGTCTDEEALELLKKFDELKSQPPKVHEASCLL